MSLQSRLRGPRLAPLALLGLTAIASPPARAQDLIDEPTNEPARTTLGTDPAAPGPLREVPIGAAATSTADAPKFTYHGYLRATVPVGFHPQTGGDYFHAPPNVPVATFGDWRNLNVVQGPWANLNLNYGNSRVTGTVSLGAYKFNASPAPTSFTRVWDSELGVYGAFVTLRQPDLFGTKWRLESYVGYYSRGYGASGRYDTGKYFTFLYGFPGGLGETTALERDFFGRCTGRVEHGFSGRNQPGLWAQGATFLNHAHVAFGCPDWPAIGVHYVDAFTHDASEPALRPFPDGSIRVMGAELRWAPGPVGKPLSLLGEWIYIGYSHMRANNARQVNSLGGAVDAQAGSGLQNSYFVNQDLATSAVNGAVHSVLFQWDISLARIVQYPKPFYGGGPDIQLSLFGLFNYVDSKPTEKWIAGATSDAPRQHVLAADPKTKARVGSEIIYTPLNWLAMTLRYDRVMPVLDDQTQTINVLTPRIVFRTRFIGAHEQIGIQYSRLWYGRNATSTIPGRVADVGAPSGDGGMTPMPDTAPPPVGGGLPGVSSGGNAASAVFDQNVLQIYASMWF